MQAMQSFVDSREFEVKREQSTFGMRSGISNGFSSSLAFLTAKQVQEFVAETGMELPAWMKNGVSRSVLVQYVETIARQAALASLELADVEVCRDIDVLELCGSTTGS